MRYPAVALVLALFVAAATAGCGLSSPAPHSPATPTYQPVAVNATKTPRLAVIAHRGASREAPENTVRAYARAAELQADYFELDLQTTRDGHIVVMHDPTVNRTTDGKGRVADMDLATIRRLNAAKGGPFTPVPTLDEALDVITDRTGAVLEFKERRKEMVAEVIARIQQRHLERSVVLESFYPELLTESKRLAPEMKTLFLYDKSTLADVQAAAADADCFGFSASAYRALGDKVDKPVWVWTVNDKQALAALAADPNPHLAGVITDDPALAQRVFAAKP